MRKTGRVTAVVVSAAMTMGAVVATAYADGSGVLYVDDSATSNCSDAGTGTQLVPFCSITAAAQAVAPGDTVEIARGGYAGAVDITAVGTAAAPITFKATGSVSITDASGQSGPALSFDGSAYVTFEGNIGLDQPNAQQFLARGVLVHSSSHIVIDGVKTTVTAAVPDSIEVTGGSNAITITRNVLQNVVVQAGGSGDVISTNLVVSGLTPVYGISVDGTADTAITSNTVIAVSPKQNAISVTGGSTGTTIENNIVTEPTGTTPGSGAEITVDATSTQGTTLDYNVANPDAFQSPGTALESAYSWSGLDYASAAALYQATGQGAHDLNSDPDLGGGGAFTNTSTAPQVNSANSAAPGMLSTDLYGQACAADPVVAYSGAGVPDYCARGAIQEQYTTTFAPTVSSQGAQSVRVDGWINQTVNEGPLGVPYNVVQAPLPSVSYTIDWGDGDEQTVQGSSTERQTETTHTYASAGTYSIKDTVTYVDGTTDSVTTPFTTVGSDYTPYGPVRLLDTRKGLGAPKAKVATGSSVTLDVGGTGSIPANITAVAVNITATDTTANGYVSTDGTGTSTLNYRAGQTIANNAIVPVTDGTIEIYNEGGKGGSADLLADVTGYFTGTTASQYGSVPLERILDTRHGIGAPQAQAAGDSSVAVTVAGVDGIPAGATAVAVHVTVTDTAGNGWIAAEPDGAGTPTTSILNYLKGQTVSNTVIVPIGADGKVELYNGGTKTPVDLLADVSGYFSADAPDSYVPITATREWDTRRLPGWTIPGNGTESAWLEGDNGNAIRSPFPDNAILISNVTVTDTTGNGFLTVYPPGTPVPAVSNLNYLTGQTVANMAILSTSGSDQEVSVYNQSSGSTDVIFDVFGYFTNS